MSDFAPENLIEQPQTEQALELEKNQSQEKVFSDFEKRNFSALDRANRPSVISQRLNLLFSSVLASFVLLMAAYFSSKILVDRFEYLPSSAIVEEEIVLPVDGYARVYDIATLNFPQTDDYASKSVLVFDLTANQAIYAKNSDTRTPIASLTKLASSAVLSEVVNPEGITEITEELETINGAAVHFKKGEKYKNIDLIKAALIASSNQGAYAVHDIDDTVRLMNELAETLKLENTKFANPAGFDDEENYSTAREFVQIAKYFFSHEDLKALTAKSREDIVEQTDGKPVRLSNTNDLLRLGTKYVVGGKTGTTPKAGQNLVLLVNKEGREYLIILLNGADRYKDAYKVLDRLP